MSIEVFGITGTNGKTTTSYMLKNILEEKGEPCGLIGTITHQIGDKVYGAVNTTPSATLLSMYFEEMNKQNINKCVMEVSSHGLVQGRVRNVEFDYAGFTNLTPEHLDYHVDMEDYFQAKSRLFYMAQKGVCINIDDAYGKRLYEEVCRREFLICKKENRREIRRVYSFSLDNPNADFYGKVLSNTLEGVSVEILFKGEKLGTMITPLIGITSAYNGLLACSLAYMAGYSTESIFAAMPKLTQISGRFEKVPNAKEYNVIIDFAHTPDAVEKVLKTARELRCKRLICVFGCGGNRDAKKRPSMGEIVGNLADICVITSDNPRFEEPFSIIKDIQKGVEKTFCRYIIEEDREKAIQRALELYEPDDLILILGKGHEKYQIIKDKKIPFDDKEVVLKNINMKE